MNQEIYDLITNMVAPLLTKPESFKIEVADGTGDNADYVEYRLFVDPSDTGRLIGRQGRIIQAIRTIVYSIPVQGKKIRILVV
jgi:predicted RNA-binding protein YlqC (UPF0109 family)